MPNGPVDIAIHQSIERCLHQGMQPIAALVAPFTLLAYQRELLPPDCFLVSSIHVVHALHAGFRVPVVTTIISEDGQVRRNLDENTVELISIPVNLQ